jgi:hypothetical protein
MQWGDATRIRGVWTSAPSASRALNVPKAGRSANALSTVGGVASADDELLSFISIDKSGKFALLGSLFQLRTSWQLILLCRGDAPKTERDSSHERRKGALRYMH